MSLNKDIEQKDAIKLKIIEIVSISVVSFFIYFVADNYHLVEQVRRDGFSNVLNISDDGSDTSIGTFVKINDIQPPLLVLGILFHQTIPKGLRAIFKPYTKDALAD